MVSQLPAKSFVLLMTMGHTTDKPILLEILKNWEQKPFPYLGVIGSKAKAVRLYQDIAEAGLPSEYKNLFYCPMGLSVGNNHPQEIAISIVSQLLQVRDSV
jgi:xanthine dehydrogenase accessory factor